METTSPTFGITRGATNEAQADAMQSSGQVAHIRRSPLTFRVSLAGPCDALRKFMQHCRETSRKH